MAPAKALGGYRARLVGQGLHIKLALLLNLVHALSAQRCLLPRFALERPPSVDVDAQQTTATVVHSADRRPAVVKEASLLAGVKDKARPVNDNTAMMNTAKNGTVIVAATKRRRMQSWILLGVGRGREAHALTTASHHMPPVLLNSAPAASGKFLRTMVAHC